MASPSTRIRLDFRWRWWFAVGAIVAVAFLARVIAVVRGGGLYGSFGYDDGVYFGAAVAFVHGLLPYRDFLFLHPPGIILGLTPFALLGSVTSDGTGMAAARLVFMALGAVNAGLVTVLGSRLGWRAGIAAGIAYALWHAAAAFERTTILLAPQSTLLLAALIVLETGRTGDGLSRLSLRRIALAGLLMGLATSIQLWGVIPMAVLAGWIVLTLRSEPLRSMAARAIVFLGSAAAAIAAVCLPFLEAVGPAMIRLAVLDQLGRPPLDVPLLARVRGLEGLSTNPQARLVPDVVAIGVAAIVVVLIVVAARRRPAVRPWIAVAAAQVAFVLSGNVFFPHYAAWPAPAMALAAGTGVAIVLDAAAPAPATAPWSRAAWGVWGARVAVVAAIVVLVFVDVRRSGIQLPLVALDAATVSSRCVAADAPVLLIETGTLRRDLVDACHPVIDPTGVSYDVARGSLGAGAVGPSREGAPAYQAAMLADYGAAQAALFERVTSDGLTAATWASLRCRLPIRLHRPPVTILLAASGGAPSPACP